jgi:hypothetical protein
VRRDRISRSFVVLVVVASSLGIFLGAGPAQAIQGSIDACFREGHHPYRIPGPSCPAHYEFIDLALGYGPPACVNEGSTIRFPQDGSCPAGFDLIQLQETSYGGFPACISEGKDYKSQKSGGGCAPAFEPIRLQGSA